MLNGDAIFIYMLSKIILIQGEKQFSFYSASAV